MCKAKDKKKVKAGRKGGYMGSGKAKTRSTEHYQRMAQLSAQKRRAKAAIDINVGNG